MLLSTLHDENKPSLTRIVLVSIKTLILFYINQICGANLFNSNVKV